MTKTALVSFVASRQHVSFAEIEQEFPEERGDQMMLLPGYPTIILWQGISGHLIDTIIDCLNDRTLTAHPMHFLAYLHDGATIRLPIAKRKIQYKKPHWMPTMFMAPRDKTRRTKIKLSTWETT